ESHVLAGLGAIVGLIAARWGGRIVRDLFLPGVGTDSGPIDGRVLGITVIATLFAALVAGLLPLLSSTKSDVSSELRGGSRGLTGGHRRALTWLLLVQT